MENVLIRKLKAEDAEDVCGIYMAITLATDMPDFKRIVEGQAKRSEDACFVAEHDGRVVGYMISYILTNSFGIEKSAWIPSLGVDPEFMGQGIGKQMADKVLAYYREKGIHDIHTSARWYDADLLSFFKTLGFDRSEFINLRKKLS